MKSRSIFFVIVLLFVSNVINAQDGANAGLKIGFAQTDYHGGDLETRLLRLDSNAHYQQKRAYLAVFGDTLTNSGIVRVVDSSFYENGEITKRNSLMAGFAINTELSPYFWLKHEFYWANKGATVVYKDDDGNETAQLTRKRMYIDIYPVMPAFHFKGAQVFFGPYLAALFLKRDQLIIYDYVPEGGGEPKDLTFDYDDISTDGFFDYGGMAGVEYEFNFGLNLGFRYYMGFGADDEAGDVKVHNRGMYFTLGYTFGKENY